VEGKKRCGPRLQRAGVGRPFAGGGSVVGATSWPMAGPQSLSTGHVLHTGTLWDPGGEGGNVEVGDSGNSDEF
jgi:hypothetical protein